MSCMYAPHEHKQLHCPRARSPYSRHPIHRQTRLIPQIIKPPTRPGPVPRILHQPTFQRIIVHAVHFFQALLLTPDVQVIAAPLPNTVMSVVMDGRRQFKPRPHLLAPGRVQVPAQVSQNEIGRALSQLLHDLGRVGQLRWPDQKVAIPPCGIKTYPMILKPNSDLSSSSVFVKCRLNRSESKMRARR